jgi:8-oxo-dGTP diphosphatase
MASNEARLRTHVGAYGICRDPDRRLLLVRIANGPDKGRWAMPGGGVEFGEHPDSTLRRELAEETGITAITDARVVHVYSYTYPQSADDPSTGFHHMGFVYHVEVGTLDVTHEVNGSTDCAAWFNQAAARALPLTPAGALAVALAWPESHSGLNP